MRLRDSLVRAPLSACALLFACNMGGDGLDKLSSADIRDNDVRRYIEDSLVPYLTLMANELCTVRLTAAPKAIRQGICVPVSKGGVPIPGIGPEGEGVTQPPKDHGPRPYPMDRLDATR